MSRDASITEPFGDGKHFFRLAIDELRELEEKRGISAFALLARLIAFVPLVDDAPEVIRIGLIGGGMKPLDALALSERYASRRPPAESIPVAIKILTAGLMGVPDEQPGKSSGEAKAPTAPPISD